MVSTASRRRISAATVRSTRLFCSVMSTAMPIRCSPGSPRWRTSFAARAQPDPVTVGVAHAERMIDRMGLGIGQLGGEFIKLDVIGVNQRADFAEGEEVVFRLKPEDARTSNATRRCGRAPSPNPTGRSGRG